MEKKKKFSLEDYGLLIKKKKKVKGKEKGNLLHITTQ